MNSISFFDRRMAWLFLAITCLSAVLLVYFIRSVIRLVKQSHLSSVALQAEQTVAFSEAGKVMLCIEGPIFTRRFARLDYELIAGDGTILNGRTALFHARTSGFSTVRMELKSYVIPGPGSYLLRIRGLEEMHGSETRERIVFMRPHLARSMVFVTGIVLSAGILITSIVFTLLCFVQNR